MTEALASYINLVLVVVDHGAASLWTSLGLLHLHSLYGFRHRTSVHAILDALSKTVNVVVLLHIRVSLLTIHAQGFTIGEWILDASNFWPVNTIVRLVMFFVDQGTLMIIGLILCKISIVLCILVETLPPWISNRALMYLHISQSATQVCRLSSHCE